MQGRIAKSATGCANARTAPREAGSSGFRMYRASLSGTQIGRGGGQGEDTRSFRAARIPRVGERTTRFDEGASPADYVIA